jgi:predicted flap endonuclease-1-like 5' DNA nuclease
MFLLALAGVAAFVWLLWWLWTRHEQEAEAPEIELEVKAPEDQIKVEAPPAPAEPPAVEVEEEETPAAAPVDDLKRIEGIGPKISSVLQAAGITTFAQLADTEVDRIEQILEEADPRLVRLAKPTTWPEQASLAAAGQWEALEALQGKLRGGRRV